MSFKNCQKLVSSEVTFVQEVRQLVMPYEIVASQDLVVFQGGVNNLIACCICKGAIRRLSWSPLMEVSLSCRQSDGRYSLWMSPAKQKAEEVLTFWPFAGVCWPKIELSYRIDVYVVFARSGLSVAVPKYFKPAALAKKLSFGALATEAGKVFVGLPFGGFGAAAAMATNKMSER